MLIIDNLFKNITNNLLLEEKNIQHLYGCSSCGYEGMLHRHGHYKRNVVTLTQHFVISIQRFLCPSCGKTFSLLPSFLIPYFIYSYDVVIYCLNSVFTLKNKFTDVCSFLHNSNNQCFISIQSIGFFKKRFLSKVDIVNSFFASIDSFHYDCDLSFFTKDKAQALLISKIMDFDVCNSFNYQFFRKTPRYFLSP
ncbi:MAG: hypothetical protein KGZ81_06060 [Flavobacteriales bacterium]|nr:hypothetical protein [Flavobacteriales bacterium]